MTSDFANILLISGSIINIFVVAILLIKNKINIAIGLSFIQALAWVFKFMKLY
jgi:hypothetical protein